MARENSTERRNSSRKKAAKPLRGVAGGAVSPEALLDLVTKLGLADIVLRQVRTRIESADMDELFDEVVAYMRRNPEVLVVSLGAVTVATGLVVWLQKQKEWDGAERRRERVAETHPGRVKRAS